MLKKELFSICTFYAISPIHAGCGAATSAVDLPIQRERHTHWPHIQASGVKGAFRDHYRKMVGEEDRYLTNLIFGIDKDNDGKVIDKDGTPLMNFNDENKEMDSLPGAISISDAKLLAFPVRSDVAPFVWVTCPSVLKRLKNDLMFSGFPAFEDPPPLTDEKAIALSEINRDKVVLEDAVVTILPLPGGESVFKLPAGFPDLERLLLISDEMFDYCVTSCTEIQTQIKIDSETGTAADTALRYQELLPSDTLLYSIVYYSGSAGLNELQATTIQSHIEEVIKEFIQIGGDETLGRGICKISWIKNGKEA